MFKLFSGGRTLSRDADFAYLKPSEYYFDSACTTLRPQVVIQAQQTYFEEYNSCGHRVTYPWGKRVDRAVESAREAVLRYLHKSSKDYSVVFTQSTTYGINLILHQLPSEFGHIYVSDIEHNSVFIPSITWAEKRGAKRTVLTRRENGGLDLPEQIDLGSVFLLNSTSNIDGLALSGAAGLAGDIHASGGILLLDACQSMLHQVDILRKTDFDACFLSGHKMYAPSLGVVVIKKSLLDRLDLFWLGGSTVEEVGRDEFRLISDPAEDFARLEPGLQNYAGIVGLSKAVSWLENWRSDLILPDRSLSQLNPQDYLEALGGYLKVVTDLPRIHKTRLESTSIISFYVQGLDSHKLGAILAEQGIMVRVGYHCCHYYLIQQRQLPPLVRVSLGLHNTVEDVAHLGSVLNKVLNTF